MSRIVTFPVTRNVPEADHRALPKARRTGEAASPRLAMQMVFFYGRLYMFEEEEFTSFIRTEACKAGIHTFSMRYSLAASSPVSTMASVKSVTFSSSKLESLKFSIPGQIFAPTASDTCWCCKTHGQQTSVLLSFYCPSTLLPFRGLLPCCSSTTEKAKGHVYFCPSILYEEFASLVFRADSSSGTKSTRR